MEFENKGEECTVIGYPTNEGIGALINSQGNSFSICEASDEAIKKGAWEFIKMLVSEEVQNEIVSNNLNDGFPINNASFERMKKASVKDEENIVEIGNGPVNIGFPTTEECDYLTGYINKIDQIKTNVYTELNNIVLEEVTTYLGGGMTAEETAKLIQNRASIMVSETAAG